MGDAAIVAEGLGKRYRIGTRAPAPDTLLAAFGARLRSPFDSYRRLRQLTHFDEDGESDVLWALRHVSFEVKHGEVLGVIGRNGAGKSTLLKILSRITEPTEGSADLHGRVASLLEVGTGFHPELTGRENVFLNGTILGMRRLEVASKFDEIVDFAGVEKFIDTPVKRFSSGMHVRLAFAVAAHLNPEILIVDEVLAVGDIEFQRKCLGKMDDVSRSGRTIIFVSHNVGAVLQLCHRALLLRQGEVAAYDSARAVVDSYLASMVEGHTLEDSPRVDRTGNGRLRFTGVYAVDRVGAKSRSLIAGNPYSIVLNYDAYERCTAPKFLLTLYNERGVAVTHCSTDSSLSWPPSIAPGSGQVRCNFEKLPLPLSRYRVAVAAYDSSGQLDWVPSACVFDVEASAFFASGFSPPTQYAAAFVEHDWHFGEP